MRRMVLRFVQSLIVILSICASRGSAQPSRTTPVTSAPESSALSKTRALLVRKDVVLVKEYSAPITLDMKQGSTVEITAYAFNVEGDASSRTKGLRFRIKYDPKGLTERMAYLDLDEAEQFSDALARLSALSIKWLEAKRKGNAETEFTTTDGLTVGFLVDSNGDHQGYFSMEGQRVNFAMSATLMMAVKGHLDKLLADLKKV